LLRKSKFLSWYNVKLTRQRSNFKLGYNYEVFPNTFRTSEKYKIIAFFYKDGRKQSNPRVIIKEVGKEHILEMCLSELDTVAQHNERISQELAADLRVKWNRHDFLAVENNIFTALTKVLNGETVLTDEATVTRILNDYKQLLKCSIKRNDKSPSRGFSYDPKIERTFEALKSWMTTFQVGPINKFYGTFFMKLTRWATKIQEENVNKMPSMWGMATIFGKRKETVGENIYKKLVAIVEREARRRGWGTGRTARIAQIDTFLCRPDQTGNINKGKLVRSHAKCKICDDYLVKRKATYLIRLNCGKTDLRDRHIFHRRCLKRRIVKRKRTCPDCSKTF